ncbi:MAG: HNH endonuclease [Bacteroidales bacterium]|nr:HNH endonuclease [Bacteroidales bacterium]
MDATDEMVKVQFINGHPYDVCRDGRIYDCDFRGTGKRVLLRQSTIKGGYKQVSVHADFQTADIRVHRLVALCFLSNPNNLPQVNHKDENPSNNRVENLEWCDAKYNVNYSISKLKNSKKYMKAKLTKDKVKAMMPRDYILVLCDTASEVDSAYQTAQQAKSELGDKGNNLCISKSNVTLSVVIRTGL